MFAEYAASLVLPLLRRNIEIISKGRLYGEGAKRMKNTSNQKKYKMLAPAYDLFMGNRLFQNARKKAFENIEFKTNDRVLLVGVGTGEDFSLLPNDTEVVGIDISTKMLARAKEKVINERTRLLNERREVRFSK
jgi:ubiquinone/menaquinone biosynthesis C-methylase UbiE